MTQETDQLHGRILAQPSLTHLELTQNATSMLPLNTPQFKNRIQLYKNSEEPK
jgi:hypothetical protein